MLLHIDTPDLKIATLKVGGAGKGGHLYGYNNDVIGIDLVQSRGLVHSGWVL